MISRIFSEIDESLDFNETLVNISLLNEVSINTINYFFAEIIIYKITSILRYLFRM